MVKVKSNGILCCSKKREVVQDLAPMLWNSYGTVAALLQEIVNIYPTINPAILTVSFSCYFYDVLLSCGKFVILPLTFTGASVQSCM